jgi:putative flavoprotein involved in K+ transport
VQIAHELRQWGCRDVILAVGSHRRVPRRYRGLDIFWWLDQLGTFDRTIDDVADPRAARSEPALQLVGRPDHDDLDLACLQDQGVALVGRLAGIDGTRAFFDRGVGATVVASEVRMRRLLARIDRFAERSGLAAEVLDPHPIRTVRAVAELDSLDLATAGIRSVVWATGYRRRYPWLELPILDGHGEICQRRGVTPVAGAYVLGQRFQYRRNSNFIDGIGRDAAYVADHIVARAARRTTLSFHDSSGDRQ